MPNRTEAPVARVRGLGELAAVVPYLLGFAPSESLVCLGVDAGRVGLVARLDLADICDPVDGDEAVHSVIGAVAASGARTGMVLVVSESEPPRDLLDRIRACARAWELVILDVGLQQGRRCRSLVCADPSCCPPDGFEVDPACHAAVEAAYAGSLVLPDREAVEAEFLLPSASARSDLDEEIAFWESRAAQENDAGRGSTHVAAETAHVLAVVAGWDSAVALGSPPPALPGDGAARLAVALVDIRVRDAVWVALDARRAHGQGLWLELAAAVPPPYDASALFLLGWRSWRHGDGVRARLGAEAALRADSGYTAALLLEQALDAHIDPNRLAPLGEGPLSAG